MQDIEPSRHHDQILYYSKYNVKAHDIPTKLAHRTVAIIGLGGVGSELVRHLAVAGIGSLICIDEDIVQITNLNRQFFYCPADVGLSKVKCIAREVPRFAPDTTVHPVETFVDSPDKLRDALAHNSMQCDFIACCADLPIGVIEQISLQIGIDIGCAVGVAGINLRRGYWGVFSGSTPMLKAKDFFKHVSDLADCGFGGLTKGSSSWTNTVISAFFAEAVIALLAELPHYRQNALCAYDFDLMKAEVTAEF